MKTIKFISQLMAVLFFVIVAVRCSEDATPIETYTISGTVTCPDFDGVSQNAEGAVVYIKMNATSATTDYDLAVVTDASGAYAFDGLSSGDYFIFANYDTENRNTAVGRIRGVVFVGEGAMVSVADADATHNFALSSLGQADALAVDTNEGGNWNQDWNHSNIDFSFPYDANNASYTGRFSDFEMYIDFDPTDLTNSSITASVDGLSVKTDSPGGRDPLYNSDGSFWQDIDGTYDFGCISGYFGIDDLLDTDRYITFESTSIKMYGDGYLATGPMTFNGATNNVDLFFRFIPGFQATSRSGVLTNYASFEGQFVFAAAADYGITSGHVGDADVTVDVSFQINQPAE